MKIKYQEDIKDYAKAFADAIASCPENGTIELDRGVYEISGKYAVNAYLYLSNNDYSEKPTALYIKGKKGLKIIGNGATLLFKDFVSGIGIVDSEDISLCDLTIDYAGNYHLEFEVDSVEDERVKLLPREGFPVSLENGEWFAEQGKVGKCLCMTFNKNTGMPSYRKRYVWVDFSKDEPRERRYMLATPYMENGSYYLRSEWAKQLEKGEVIVICYNRTRYHQSVYISDSKNVALNGVDIAYSPSMGVVAQLTDTVTLDNVRIERNGRHGLISSRCDATHFIQCSGKLRIANGRFFNMMDDVVNIHGNYMTVRRVTDEGVFAEIMHHQQRGVRLVNVGERVSVYKGKTCDLRCEPLVLESKLIDPSTLLLVTDGETGIESGDVLCNTARMPEVEIENVACGNNRPRGILLNSSKKTVVRNCIFSNSENGIELAGDTNYWYESGPCNDVTIENCTFLNCNHADGDYAIKIHPIFDQSGQEKYYHKNVTVRNNRFLGFQNGMLTARCVEHLSVYDNAFVQDPTFPARKLPCGKLDIQDCLVDRTRNNIDEAELFSLLAPVWKGKRVKEQTAVFVGKHDTAPLLFPCAGNVTVTDFSGIQAFEEGKDFAVTERGVTRLDGAIPFYSEEEFYRKEADAINVRVDPEKLTFPDGEKRYFKFGGIHARTVRISYDTKEKGDIFGLDGKAGCCECFKAKAQAGEPATVLFYGDSITEGANASAELRVMPFQDMWAVLSHAFLKRYYRNEQLRYINTAVGGKDSVWGLENFEDRVLSHNPDLVVLAFGMNDGGKPVEEYGRLIEGMIARLQERLPACEVVLVATSVPNPISCWYGNQTKFITALNALSEKYGIPVMDMTGLTETLYGEKTGILRYHDFTGNNVNHPNDFGMRLYAQAFLSTLLGKEYTEFFENKR